MDNEVISNSTQIIAGIISFAVYLVTVIGMWKVFSKMGVFGLLAFIPVVNVLILYHKVRGSAWKALISLIPVIGWIYGILTNFKLSRSFGHGTGFGFGLLFFPEIFFLILGFGKSKYLGPNR